MSNDTDSKIIDSTSSTCAATVTTAITNSKELLNFYEILQLFNCAISEQQAWAVLYEIILEFKNLFQLIEQSSNGEESQELYRLLILNQDFIDLRSIYFSHDGCVYLQLKKSIPVANSQINSQKKSPSKTQNDFFFFNYLNYMNSEQSGSNLQNAASNVSSEQFINFGNFQNKIEIVNVY